MHKVLLRTQCKGQLFNIYSTMFTFNFVSVA